MVSRLLDENDITISRLKQEVERLEKDNSSLVEKNAFLHEQLHNLRTANKDLQTRFEKLERSYRQAISQQNNLKD